MSSPFVWFHHNGENPQQTKDFFEALLGWQGSDGPSGMTMLSADAGPFAALASSTGRYGAQTAWIPFVEVEDVDAATARAIALGASLVQDKSRGPAGEFSIINDPSGSTLGLWRKA